MLFLHCLTSQDFFFFYLRFLFPFLILFILSLSCCCHVALFFAPTSFFKDSLSMLLFILLNFLVVCFFPTLSFIAFFQTILNYDEILRLSKISISCCVCFIFKFQTSLFICKGSKLTIPG